MDVYLAVKKLVLPIEATKEGHRSTITDDLVKWNVSPFQRPLSVRYKQRRYAFYDASMGSTLNTIDN